MFAYRKRPPEGSWIGEGLMPMILAEGRYDRRLEIIMDLPKASVKCLFDQTDMANAEEVLGDTACIAGYIPAFLIATGTSQDVKAYYHKFIEVCGRGGGYILTGGVSIDRGKSDNLHAMMEAARECGVYRK